VWGSQKQANKAIAATLLCHFGRFSPTDPILTEAFEITDGIQTTAE
jgi:hypothetical protein